MKKLFLMLVLAGAAATGYSQDAPKPVDPNAPELKFESTTLDYGTIQQDADGNREFKFVNTGKTPLIISSCRGSCGCTVPKCPTEPILPGAKGVIKVHYDTHRVGPFTKTVTVTSNAKNENETLKITGTILENKTEGAAAPAAGGK
jgi:hypothetical protein